MKPFSEETVLRAFAGDNLVFFNQAENLESYLSTFKFKDTNLLMMSSGNFGGLDLISLNLFLINL